MEFYQFLQIFFFYYFIFKAGMKERKHFGREAVGEEA